MTAAAPPRAPSLLAHPGFTFGQLDASLSALGLAREPDTTLTAPILPGEPELAAWRHPDGGRIVYTFNPVVRLRVLAFHGTGVDELRRAVAEQVPQLGIGAAEQLLDSRDPREILLGLLAAGEMEARPLLPRIGLLRAHPHEVVRNAAGQAYARLGGDSVDAVLGDFARRKAAHPGRSTLFPLTGDASARRQVVRWMMHDRRDANPHVVQVLRTALADEDWEVRASAMIAAARLRAKELWREVRQANLPKTSREGLDAADRDVLLAARAAAADLISGTPVPPLDAASGDAKQAVRAHIARCVAGEAPARADRVFLLLHALAAPVPPPEPPPPSIPAALSATETEGRYRLANGMEMVWIPPLPHWLGDGTNARQVAHPTGFWIAAAPLADGAMGVDDARRRCANLSAALEMDVTLPTADEWEMAVRGPDARRYPWGNGYEPDMLHRASPWGVEQPTGVIAQWTLSADGTPTLRGAPDHLACTDPGERPTATSSGAVRPVIHP